MGKIEKRKKIRGNIIRNMSAKKAFIFIFIGALITAVAACFCLILVTSPLRSGLIYGTREFDAVNTMLMCSFVLVTLFAIIGGSYFIWRVKFQKPIAMLMKGTEHIANNDLDFEMKYEADDEMGKLCSSFEKMRLELYQSKIESWRMVEERKRLNAAFAHDLRTPLTVLQGYTDFLEEYIPSGQRSDEKLIDTNRKMAASIDKLGNYVNMMSEIQRIEDTPVDYKYVTAGKLKAALAESVETISKQFHKEIVFTMQKQFLPCMLDMEIVLRVAENLMRNGCSNAARGVSLSIRQKEGLVCCTVEDDGPGFTEDYLQKAFSPFYRSENKGFGMGLYICKVLCGNHNGYIKVFNGAKGAVVEAEFSAESNKQS